MDEHHQGITVENAEFYDSGGRSIDDEPSDAEKQRRYEAAIAPLRERERSRLRDLGLDPDDLSGVRASNAGAYRDLEDRVRVLGVKSSLLEAVIEALAEPTSGIADPMSEVSEKRDRGNVVDERMLQRDGLKIVGGSSSGRTRSKKKGTWICKVCYLEYCEHRDRGSRGGRPPIGLEPKSRKKSIRITPGAEAGFIKAGISEGAALEILGQALLSEKTFEEVRLNHVSLTAVA